MKRCLGILAVTILILSGCGSNRSGDKSPTAATTASASGAPASTTSSISVATPTAGTREIPDPCTLFSDAEVIELTGRQITQIDKDGSEATATTRYCQWQQVSGQLAVFLTRTTKKDFTFSKADSPSIAGIGDDAYWTGGHLFVLLNTIQIDVYDRGGDENQNLAEAKKVAAALLPKVADFD